MKINELLTSNSHQAKKKKKPRENSAHDTNLMQIKKNNH
jgi:hypothetical protein